MEVQDREVVYTTGSTMYTNVNYSKEQSVQRICSISIWSCLYGQGVSARPTLILGELDQCTVSIATRTMAKHP